MLAVVVIGMVRNKRPGGSRARCHGEGLKKIGEEPPIRIDKYLLIKTRN
jgi:hypothetical protein